MRALVGLTISLLTLNAHAQAPTCAAVFSEQPLIQQLAGLRTQINSQSAAGQQDLARLLYSNYRTKLAEARSLGLDTSALEKNIAREQATIANDQRAEHERARRAHETEIRDISSWTLAETIPGVARGDNYVVSLSPSADRVSYMTQNGVRKSVHIRDLTSGRELLVLSPRDGALFNYDINWTLGLVSIRTLDRSNNTEMVSVHSLTDGQELWQAPAESVALSQTQPVLAVSNGMKVKVVDAFTGQLVRQVTSRLIQRYLGRRLRAGDLVWSPGSDRLLIRDNTVARVFSLNKTGEVRFPIEMMWEMAFVPNSDLIAIARHNNTIDFINPVKPDEVLASHRTPLMPSGLRFSGSGDRLFYHSPGSVRVLNVASMSLEHIFPEGAAVYSNSFPEGARAFAYAVDGSLKIYRPPEMGK